MLEYATAHWVAVTCRHFGIARSTDYRWGERYDARDLTTLESRSSCPRRRPRPTWTAARAEAVRRAREVHPWSGKDKLAVVLRRQDVCLSVSMVGRILADLKRRGLVVEPVVRGGRPHARHNRPYAVRKPKEYWAEALRDLVQVDTMHLTPLPGLERRQFTAVDVHSRYSVVGVRSCGTAGIARDFPARTPFSVRALQVDGVRTFMAEFEAACRERALPLFARPPRSPELNGYVERGNRTYRTEFWEVHDGDLKLPPLQQALREWEVEYIHVRPHQALGYLTPAAYLASLGEHHV